MKKKLLLTASIIAWLSLTGWSFAFDSMPDTQVEPQPHTWIWMEQKIHNKYEELKEHAKARYEKFHNFIKQKTSNIDMQKIKENFAEKMHMFKENLPSNPQELKQKFYQLKSKLATATTKEKQELVTKLNLIKQKYYGVANRPHTQYWPSTWVVKPNTVVKPQIVQYWITLPSQLKQKIDSILDIKLFKKIEGLPIEKQVEILNKVNNKVVYLTKNVKTQLKENYSKRLAYKYSILSYLDQKVNTKLKNIESVDSILSEALGK